MNYLLYNLGKTDDRAYDPVNCCKYRFNIPEFCLGLCTWASWTQNEIGARSVRSQRLNACSKYEAMIEECFPKEPVPQERPWQT